MVGKSVKIIIESKTTNRYFLAGLFFITAASLSLEIMNTRLLSVVTWYHLSFFAVSMAMFGMAAGALWVYLRPSDFTRELAYSQLYSYSILFAVSTLLCHFIIISIPLNIDDGWSASSILVLTLMTIAIAVPFFFSGIVVTVALTKVSGGSGLIYAIDLFGAACGSILSLPLLASLDITSATIIASFIAVLGVASFAMAGKKRLSGLWVVLGMFLVVLAISNHQWSNGFRVAYPKGHHIVYDGSMEEYWSIHGQILVHPQRKMAPFFWGPGKGAPTDENTLMYPLLIDGEAGTAITYWDGNKDTLLWPQYDVTSLPYHLRPGGKVAVIGVGGGRDILTALWAGSTSITGIEINKGILRVLSNEKRDFVNLVTQPEVDFVHDEARSYLTRTDDTFDVLQMSLIDTWAATGAGAFTLSENGLYTIEGWQIFLNTLAPGGLFSVSRWYSPDNLSETNRLLSLAVASLLEYGVSNPADHLALLARGSVATLLTSAQPLSAWDIERLKDTADKYEFEILHAPTMTSNNILISNILASKNFIELEKSIQHPYLDFSPPTDSRPYFFNILKPNALFGGERQLSGGGVISSGNILATKTLLILCALSFIGIILVVLIPLIKVGKPNLPTGVFSHGLMYFALIGTGFMMVQIPLIQRFSVYLGHPVYAVAVLLFSMILSAGIGSLLSDRIDINRNRIWTTLLPITITVLLLFMYVISGWVIANTIDQTLIIRCLIVVLLVATLALPMGMCFPLGLRLFREHADKCLPWMWGINGATGVLASVLAVAISMWSGINTSLLIAAMCYSLLIIPARNLSKSLGND